MATMEMEEIPVTCICGGELAVRDVPGEPPVLSHSVPSCAAFDDVARGPAQDMAIVLLNECDTEQSAELWRRAIRAAHEQSAAEKR